MGVKAGSLPPWPPGLALLSWLHCYRGVGPRATSGPGPNWLEVHGFHRGGLWHGGTRVVPPGCALRMALAAMAADASATSCPPQQVSKAMGTTKSREGRATAGFCSLSQQAWSILGPCLYL